MTRLCYQSTVVVKLGGSILQDRDSIDKAVPHLDALRRKGIGVVLVVSAMKGETDRLLSMSRELNPSMDPEHLDELLSSGERRSARLVASVLADHGLNPKVFDPGSPEWPIITDDKHLDADPLIEQTRGLVTETICLAVERGEMPVVCGFLGRTRSGKITTLGRGGSDTTAVLLGNCLGSKEVVLVKDVEGVYSSDPDRVENPLFIENLNSEEAEKLAAGGAKFLHLKALRYQSPGLKIRVTSLENLDSGTIIEGDIPDVTVDITTSPSSMITVIGLDSGTFEPVAKLAQSIRNSGATLLALTLESGSGIFYISGGTGVLGSVHDLIVGQKLGKAASSFDGLSMLTVKGKALETQPGVVQRIVQPLSRSGINIFGVVTIFSSVRVFVSSEDSQRASSLVRDALLVGER